MKKLVLLTTLVLALGIFVAACGSDDSDSGSGSSGVEVTDVWARPSTMTQNAGAVYMTITSKDGDTLTAAKVPTSVAGMTQLHETTTNGEPTDSESAMESGDSSSMDSGDTMDSSNSDSMNSSDSMDGTAMMGMKEVDQIDIPAGETVKLEPGGYHIMLLDLKGQIKSGDTIPVTLTFKKAGTVKVDAAAQDQ